MKNTIIAAVAALTALFGSAAHAGDINVLLYYKAGGTYDRINQQVIAPALGDKFGELVAIKGCAPMKNYFDNTSDKVFAIWDIENNLPLADGSENPCFMSNEHVSGVAFSLPFNVCHRKDDVDKSLTNFRTDKDIVVGIYGYSVYKGMLEDIMADVNPNATLIPYSSSRKYLPALAGGEVDYLFVTQKNDTMTCTATTHEVGINGMETVSGFSNSVFADKSNVAVFVTKNMSADEAEEVYRQVISSDAYADKINVIYQRSPIMDKSRSEQIEILDDYKKNLFENVR